MKLEIELDLNKIDYEAINKQIHDKIEAMNIADAYAINSKIRDKVNEEVSDRVRQVMDRGPWSYGVSEDVKYEINKEISSVASSLIQPRIDEILNKIPQEEIDKMVIDLFPKVLIELITQNIHGVLHNTYTTTHSLILNDAMNHFNAILRR